MAAIAERENHFVRTSALGAGTGAMLGAGAMLLLGARNPAEIAAGAGAGLVVGGLSAAASSGLNELLPGALGDIAGFLAAPAAGLGAAYLVERLHWKSTDGYITLIMGAAIGALAGWGAMGINKALPGG